MTGMKDMMANCAQTLSKLLTKVKRNNDREIKDQKNTPKIQQNENEENEDCGRNNHQRKR